MSRFAVMKHCKHLAFPKNQWRALMSHKRQREWRRSSGFTVKCWCLEDKADKWRFSMRSTVTPLSTSWLNHFVISAAAASSSLCSALPTQAGLLRKAAELPVLFTLPWRLGHANTCEVHWLFTHVHAQTHTEPQHSWQLSLKPPHWKANQSAGFSLWRSRRGSHSRPLGSHRKRPLTWMFKSF